MSRDNTVQARLTDNEYSYLEQLAEEMEVSHSEAIRVLLYDSRFLYAEGVDFGGVDIDAEELIEGEDSATNGEDAVERIFQ